MFNCFLARVQCRKVFLILTKNFKVNFFLEMLYFLQNCLHILKEKGLNFKMMYNIQEFAKILLLH